MDRVGDDDLEDARVFVGGGPKSFETLRRVVEEVLDLQKGGRCERAAPGRALEEEEGHAQRERSRRCPRTAQASSLCCPT